MAHRTSRVLKSHSTCHTNVIITAGNSLIIEAVISVGGLTRIHTCIIPIVDKRIVLPVLYHAQNRDKIYINCDSP